MEPSIYKPSIYNGAGIYKIGGGSTPPTPPPEPDPDLYQIGNAMRCVGSSIFYVDNNAPRTEINKDDVIKATYSTNAKSDYYTTPVQPFYCNKENTTGQIWRKVIIDDWVNRFTYRICNGGTTETSDSLNVTLNYPLTVAQYESVTKIGNRDIVYSQLGTEKTWLKCLYSINSSGYTSYFYPLIVEDTNGNEKYKFWPVMRKQDSVFGFYEPSLNIFAPQSGEGTIELI